MSIWTQNLNILPGPVPDRHGSILWHGRASLRDDSDRFHFGVEWRLGRMGFGASVGILSDDDVGGSLRLPGLSVYWHASSPVTRWLREKTGYREREVSFSVHDWMLTFYPWVDPMGGWSSAAPWWSQSILINLDPVEWGVWRWLRRMIGASQRHTEETLMEKRVLVALPEGTTAVVFRWKRSVYPRWPFRAQVIERWHVEPEKPLAVPGKGENSWDCDDDAIYAMSLPADVYALHDAVGAVSAVYRDRMRYAGSETWTPAKEAT